MSVIQAIFIVGECGSSGLPSLLFLVQLRVQVFIAVKVLNIVDLLVRQVFSLVGVAGRLGVHDVDFLSARRKRSVQLIHIPAPCVTPTADVLARLVFLVVVGIPAVSDA